MAHHDDDPLFPAPHRPQPRHRPPTGTPNQRWRFEADPQGWELVVSHRDNSIDLPESGLAAGVRAIRFRRPTGVDRTLRLRGNPASGRRSAFAHPELALSVTGTAGAPVVRQRTNPSTNQVLDLHHA